MTHAPRSQANASGSCNSSIALLLLNITFWLLAPLVTVTFLLLALVIVPLYLLATGSRRQAKWLIRRLISYYGATVLRCAWPWVKVKYVETQPRGNLPCVFVANHRAASDAYLMACLPHECIQVMNIWPSKIPIFGRVARLAQYMSVRQMPFEQFLDQGSKLLAQGVSIIAFPEGRRSGSPQMGPFHGSVFRLAQANGVPIVPLAIHGNEHIPPRGSFVLRPGRITITRLPAITAADYHDDLPFTLKTRVHDQIQSFLHTFNTQAGDDVSRPAC
jgi:1-acyl-sn-glycerol-3-phosphate acyltransferase